MKGSLGLRPRGEFRYAQGSITLRVRGELNNPEFNTNPKKMSTLITFNFQFSVFNLIYTGK